MPARLLLLCLPLRSSWLTVEGGRGRRRHSAASPGRTGQPWPCRSAWLLAFQSGSQEWPITGRRGFCCWAEAATPRLARRRVLSCGAQVRTDPAERPPGVSSRAAGQLIPSEIRRGPLERRSRSLTLSGGCCFGPRREPARGCRGQPSEWNEWACGVPIEVLLDPQRSLVRSVLRYVKSVEDDDATIVVLISEILHNQRPRVLSAVLKARTNVVIATLPFHLHD